LWKKEHEVDAFRNMLEKYGGQGQIFACVSDTYDIFNATSNLWGGTLREEVINSGSTLVIRPDSGHPATIVLQVLQRLEEKFGITINSKGYKVLNNVRVIQGDGIEYDSIAEILSVATDAGYSATNIAFGMGGALLQKVNRDTFNFAHKACYAVVNNELRDIYKDPVTGSWKKSKSGDLDLYSCYDSNGKNYKTLVPNKSHIHLKNGDLSWLPSATRIVYENGNIVVDDTFSAIRARACETLDLPTV